MARFVFSLQAVLDQRRAVERERQVEVGTLEGKRRALEEAIRGAQREIGAARERRRRGLVEALDMRAARAHAAEEGTWERRAQALAIELAGLLKRLEGARGRLAEAVRDRRAIERLRERRYEEWRRERERLERNELDELAVMRAQPREVSP